MSNWKQTVRKSATPIFVAVIVVIITYQEIRSLAQGASLGNGITDIVVGAMIIGLYTALEGIRRASDASRFDDRVERLATLALLTTIIAASAVLIYTVPNSPEAVGMLVVCVVGALVVIFRSPGQQQTV